MRTITNGGDISFSGWELIPAGAPIITAMLTGACASAGVMGDETTRQGARGHWARSIQRGKTGAERRRYPGAGSEAIARYKKLLVLASTRPGPAH